MLAVRRDLEEMETRRDGDAGESPLDASNAVSPWPHLLCPLLTWSVVWGLIPLWKGAHVPFPSPSIISMDGGGSRVSSRKGILHVPP